MNPIIVGCEISQRVTLLLRKNGVEAYSCDISNRPVPNEKIHIRHDILTVLKMRKWGGGIFFPPCEHLCVSGNRHRAKKKLDGREQKAIDFFLALANYPLERSSIENSKGIMSTIYRKPDQIVQPWMFGHGEVKGVCLWLNNLPPLLSTNIVEGREPAILNYKGPVKDRAYVRSLIYPGIAQAMADQWAPYFLS